MSKYVLVGVLLSGCATPQQSASTLNAVIKVANGICSLVPVAAAVVGDVDSSASPSPKETP